MPNLLASQSPRTLACDEWVALGGGAASLATQLHEILQAQHRGAATAAVTGP